MGGNKDENFKLSLATTFYEVVEELLRQANTYNAYFSYKPKHYKAASYNVDYNVSFILTFISTSFIKKFVFRILITSFTHTSQGQWGEKEKS